MAKAPDSATVTVEVAALALALFIGREGFGMIQAARSADFTGGCGCGHEKEL